MHHDGRLIGIAIVLVLVAGPLLLGLAGLIRIDHCFVSGLTALGARVVPLPGSDHLGLFIDVQQEAR